MNKLEKDMLKLNAKMLSKTELITGIKHKIEYLPLELAILELALKEKNRLKEKSASSEVSHTLEVLSIFANALDRLDLNEKFVNERSFFHVILDDVSSGGDLPVEEHDLEKLPHES
jgi:hypothetical protein